MSHSPRPSRILPEIVPNIIAHLAQQKHANTATLRACSTVSKVWLHSTRAIIFEEVALDESIERTTALISLLNHPLCTFASYVKHLTIHSHSQRSGMHLKETVPALRLFGASVIRLTIVDVHWSLLPRTLRAAICTHFQDVTTLRLMDPDFNGNFDDFASLLNSFPVLHDLEIVMDPREMHAPLEVAGAPPTCALTQLNSLLLSRCDVDCLLPFFATSASAKSIRSVTIGGVEDYQYETVSAFLNQVGPAIEDLALGTTSLSFHHGISSPADKSLDLSPLHNLKQMTFLAVSMDTPLSADMASDWNVFIPHALHTLASAAPSLECVRICLTAYKYEGFRELDWAVMGAAPLRKLVLDFQPSERTLKIETLTKDVDAVMEQLRGRGAKEIVVRAEKVSFLKHMRPSVRVLFVQMMAAQGGFVDNEHGLVERRYIA